MKVKVHLFASLAEETGEESLECEIGEGEGPQAILQRLAERFPSIRPRIFISRVAVNHRFADGSTPIGRDDEVAVIPPVSGG